jgi:hypothetical protein
MLGHQWMLLLFTAQLPYMRQRVTGMQQWMLLMLTVQQRCTLLHALGTQQ